MTILAQVFGSFNFVYEGTIILIVNILITEELRILKF